MTVGIICQHKQMAQLMVKKRTQMGIPSYYRKLARSIKGLYCERPSLDWLLMDYNCLIYQVLHTMRPYPGSIGGDAWEKEFISEVTKYTSSILNMAGVDESRVYIAIDGVVPLAKMRQQRMRRFRSIVLAEEEHRLGIRNGLSWDTNAITPGTAFMAALSVALRRAFPSATISDTEELGEGEHKVMRFMRGLPARQNVAIYGLDGDLFVLSLLNNQMFCRTTSIYFFREEEEKNKVDYVWLSLNSLKGALLDERSPAIDGQTWLLEYAIAMSILGNDFVPNSLGLRIKEDGHERLLDYLRRLHDGGDRLLVDGELSDQGWGRLFEWLARDEQKAVFFAIKRKLEAKPSRVGNSAAEAARARMNDRPLEWAAENDGQLFYNGSGGVGMLRRDWRSVYCRAALGAPAGLEAHYMEDSAKQYLQALSWVFQYYCKDCLAVDYDWTYNYPIAPLFAAVKGLIGAQGGQVFDDLAVNSAPKPSALEQLALVLPKESYWLMPKCAEREFFIKGAHYFPETWHYYSFGKRHFWECEAEIPIPTIKGLRSVLADNQLP
jgi:5'-3' exonuclease